LGGFQRPEKTKREKEIHTRVTTKKKCVFGVLEWGRGGDKESDEKGRVRGRPKKRNVLKRESISKNKRGKRRGKRKHPLQLRKGAV